MTSIKKELDLRKFSVAEVAYLAVKGMTCPHCAVRINNKLQRLDGVLMSFVLVAQNLVAVLYDPQQISELDLAQTVSTIKHSQHYFQVQVVSHVPMNEIFSVLH